MTPPPAAVVGAGKARPVAKTGAESQGRRP